MNWLRTFVVATALVLVAGTCSSDGGSDPAGTAALPKGLVNQLLEGRVEVRMTGDIEAQFSGVTPINVLTRVDDSVEARFWQLTVGILPQHLLEAGDLHLRPAFDLIGYDGNGDYTIRGLEEGGLSEEELEEARRNPAVLEERQPGAVASNAFVVVGQGESTPTNFNVMLEPCNLRVGRLGLAGSVRCPSLTDGTDVVGLEWSWTADPERVLQDLTESDVTTTTSHGGEDQGDGPTPTTSPLDRPTTSTTAPRRDSPPALEAPFPLEVKVEPKGCLTAGTVITIELDTVPSAFVTLVHVYSDANHYGNTTLGRSNARGAFNAAFAVPPAAPEGDTHLLVQVSTGEESGGGAVPVGEVRPSC